MKLFISYARVDRVWCVQLIRALRDHDLWYDQRLYAGANWWQEIYRRLEWCEAFIYLLSPESLASPACRREFNLACSLGRVVLPLTLQTNLDLPPELRALHYIDCSAGLGMEPLRQLKDSLRAHAEMSRAHIPTSARQGYATTGADAPGGLDAATAAMQAGQYDEAVFLLRRVRAAGGSQRFAALDSLLHEAENGLQHQQQARNARREYQQIAGLVKLERTRKTGCEAFRAFRERYPGHDPEGLARLCQQCDTKCANGPDMAQQAPVASNTMQQRAQPAMLPLLEWCDVPAGALRLQASARQVTAFRISRYPVTNAQFRAFVQDPHGYADERWWLPAAQDWRARQLGPRPPTFRNDLRPRENINWYEAQAFCSWLGARLGVAISLPTDLQWQRAARGDDRRAWPWGDEFDESRCNVSESGIHMTSLVTRYANGASPCGARDMAGNVWEWCRDVEPGGGPLMVSRRLVRGGSFLSVAARARIDFRFSLSPLRRHATVGFRLVQELEPLRG